MVLEFPTVAAWEALYAGPVHQGLKAVRAACKTRRMAETTST